MRTLALAVFLVAVYLAVISDEFGDWRQTRRWRRVRDDMLDETI